MTSCTDMKINLPIERFRNYRGYENRDTPPEDAELTHVGPGTPCGEYLRRFWHGIALSKEVGDLPLAIRLFGEDLVLFRDGRGQIGLLHRHCAHRGASLEYGRIQERGNPLLLPRLALGRGRHAAGSAGRARQTARSSPGSVQGGYPALEYKGIIFAYLRATRGDSGVPRLRHLRDSGHRDGALHLLLSPATGCRSPRTASTPCTPCSCTPWSTGRSSPTPGACSATSSITKAHSPCTAPSRGEWMHTSGPGCRRTSCPTSPSPARSTASTVTYPRATSAATPSSAGASRWTTRTPR